MNPHAPPHDGWIAHHPQTGRTTEHDTLAQAVVWFAGETLEWAARRYVLPVLLAAVVLGVVLWRGVRP